MRPCATGSRSTPQILETQRAKGVLSSKVSKKNAPIGARSQLGSRRRAPSCSRARRPRMWRPPSGCRCRRCIGGCRPRCAFIERPRQARAGLHRAGNNPLADRGDGQGGVPPACLRLRRRAPRADGVEASSVRPARPLNPLVEAAGLRRRRGGVSRCCYTMR